MIWAMRIAVLQELMTDPSKLQRLLQQNPALAQALKRTVAKGS